ncbi:MAG: hypothetical protein DMD67_12425 [Gemmatimonadetes bacterium]|nr:MAG: hypothetical protein DMD67_12425 [Gemmatimonadota bacterium]
MAMSIAGIVEPRLVPPHLWPAAPSSAKPPEAIDQLLRDVAAGSASARLAPGLAGFISPDMRERVARRLKGATAWTFVGCDDVDGRGMSRLGTQITRICYAKGLGPAPNSLATVLYGADWRAAGIEFYSF